MAQSFAARQLYGGAIEADLPTNFLDASDLRQVPDHQEVFLSPDTLTSIIFEINEYQNTTAVDVHSNIRRMTSNQLSEDEAASTHHFLDPVTPPDKIDPDSITTPPIRVTLARQSDINFKAYQQTGDILSPELDRTAKSILPPDWHTNPAIKTSTIKVYQLLIRMPDHDTDLCIRVNVPLKELEGSQNQEAITKEIALGQSIVDHVIQSIDIKDLSLFGGS